MDAAKNSKLIAAIKGGNVNEVRKLIKPGLFGIIGKTDVNKADAVGAIPLIEASEMGHKNIAELLIAKGANINVAGKFGETPLHSASRYGHKGIVDLLIGSGVDVDPVNEFGSTPLSVASMGGIQRL